MTMCRASALAFCAAAGLAGHASAWGIVWDESVNGDLSGDRFNPNNLTLHAGTNSLIASSTQNDREYVHFHLPTGTSLTGIIHVSWQTTGDNLAFIGVQAGSIFTEPPTGTTVGNLLGYSHFGPDEGTVGQDILPLIGQGFGAIGFTPPLTGSDYTFWLQQQSSPSVVTYRLDFEVAPAPGAIGLAGSAGMLLLAPRRSRRA